MTGMELWWIGQSGFRLREPGGGPTAFVDAFISPHPKRTWESPAHPVDLAAADVVLCTHEHIDHFDQPAIRAANETPGARFKLVVPTPIMDQAAALGVPKERIIGMQPGETVEAGGVRIHAVPASHGINVSDAYNFGEQLSGGQVRYLGYVIEMGGVRAYHAGDTIVFEGLAAQVKALKPHLALLPINGRGFYREHELNMVGNTGAREAVELAVNIGAPMLVPTHWEMFPHNRGYPRDVVSYVEENYPELTVLIFGHGAKLTYVAPEG
jgi:L-ascorbate 6-phosphate lactonase